MSRPAASTATSSTCRTTPAVGSRSRADQQEPGGDYDAIADAELHQQADQRGAMSKDLTHAAISSRPLQRPRIAVVVDEPFSRAALLLRMQHIMSAQTSP
jgi:hypothetical protein